MGDPVILNLQFEQNGDIQVHWTRPDDHSMVDATYYTTLVSREGQESDQQLNYWADELRGDALEFLMAFLKLRNTR